MSTIEQYRTQINQLNVLAANQLANVWGQVDGPASARQALGDTVPDIVAVYGLGAGAIAADWYDETRLAANIEGRFQAIVADLPDLGRTEALAGWAASTGATTESTLALAQGGLQRIIADVGRQTVAGSAVADPRARGWQRSASGGCTFCQMIASRGAVFTASTGVFASHDHCKCVAVPAWGGQPLPVNPYTPTLRNVTDADRAAVRRWLADNADRFS